ncbi:MAG: hypothetical protein KBD83_04590 [Gammaproteobacteria bacterium]|nr:hypothetical protein [Gammaproteobacteria bacterium]
MIDAATILQILDLYDQKKTRYSSLFPNRTIVAIKKLLPEFSPDAVFAVLQRHQWTLEKNTATDICVAQMLVKLFIADFVVTEDFPVTLLNHLKIMAHTGLLEGDFQSARNNYFSLENQDLTQHVAEVAQGLGIFASINGDFMRDPNKTLRFLAQHNGEFAFIITSLLKKLIDLNFLTGEYAEQILDDIIQVTGRNLENIAYVLDILRKQDLESLNEIKQSFLSALFCKKGRYAAEIARAILCLPYYNRNSQFVIDSFSTEELRDGLSPGIFTNPSIGRYCLIKAIMTEAGIVTIKMLINLGPAMIHDLVGHPYKIIRLMREACIPFEKVIALTPAIRDYLIANISAIRRLMTNAHISFETLWHLVEPTTLNQLIVNSCDIITLMTGETRVLFETLIALEPWIRDHLSANYDGISVLMREAHIPFETLMAVEPSIRGQLIANPYHLLLLVGLDRIPFETLIALESTILDQLITNCARVLINLRTSPLQTHQYLIINNIITEAELAISLINQTPYPIIQNFVNEKLLTLGILPEGCRLNAENITDLIQLVKGVAEIRKNSRVLSQSTPPLEFSSNANRIFFFMPDALKTTIAGFTGNDHADESRIAARNHGKPGSRGI